MARFYGPHCIRHTKLITDIDAFIVIFVRIVFFRCCALARRFVRSTATTQVKNFHFRLFTMRHPQTTRHACYQSDFSAKCGKLSYAYLTTDQCRNLIHFGFTTPFCSPVRSQYMTNRRAGEMWPITMAK